MSLSTLRHLLLAVLLTVFVFALATSGVHAKFMENFDGGGTTAYSLTNTSGAPPAILDSGSTGDYVRLANLNESNNNSIAFDEEPTQTGPAPAGLRLAFDFRMTGDSANDEAGGCCGSAADGLGIGMFTTSAYGTSGGNNPAAAGGIWERPAFPDAFAIGLDIFQNIDVVSLNWGGTQVAEADVQPFLDLNSGVFHRAVVDIAPDGANAMVNMDIIEDVHGATMSHNIFTDQPVAGLDVANLPGYRVIAGGRTGGAFVDGDLDNIFLVSIPEPTSMLLLALGGVLLLLRRSWAG